MQARQTRKKYIVRLSNDDFRFLKSIVADKGSRPARIKRAKVLLSSAEDLTDSKVAELAQCRIRTVEAIRRRFATGGIAIAMNGKAHSKHEHRPPLLTGDTEERAKAIYHGPIPNGYSKWSLRRLAAAVIEAGLTKAITHETMRRYVKRWAVPRI